MDAFFFYFSLSNKDKALQYLQILHRIFSEVFEIEYKGFSYQNNEDLLQTKEKHCDEIWGVYSQSKNAPYSVLKFWDDSFSISLQLDYHMLKSLHLWNNNHILQEKAKIFTEKVVGKVPILGMHFWNADEPFEEGWRYLQEKDAEKYVYFAYIQENGKMRYIEGKFYKIS